VSTIARVDGLASPVQGTLFEGRVAAVHTPINPLQYPDGPEFRKSDELPGIAAQLAGKPLTLNHPEGMIGKGARAHIIGKVVGARVEGDHVIASFMVSDPGALKAIREGTQDLSMGYDCTLDASRYQHNLTLDHLAVVPRARCSTCNLRADAAVKCFSRKELGEFMPHNDELSAGTMPVNLPDTVSNQCNCGCSGKCVTEITGAQGLRSAREVPSPDTSTGTSLAGVGVTANLQGVEVSDHADKKLNAAARHALPAKHFAVPGREDLPIEDEGHVRAAMARFNQEKFQGPAERKSAFHRIVARAHELGIDPKDFEKKHGGRLDDMEPDMDSRKDEAMSDPDGDVPSGGGDGRAQTGPDPGYAAPDIHAKLTAALEGMKELQAKYDAEKAAHGVTMAAQVQAEKDRDEGKAHTYNALKDAAMYKDRADKAEKELAEYKDRADKAEKMAKEASDKARLDADVEFQTRVTAAANSRAVLLTDANRILGAADKDGKAIDRSKMSDRDIKVAVIKHVDSFDGEPEANLVDGMYAGALLRSARVTQSLANVRQTLHQNRLDSDRAPIGGLDAERVAQTEMTNRASTAWQPRK